ncbi:MAG: hypothetical protein GX558_00790 [Clostridiales bacterium]|nr:hypothetical protein [Clostridiales bacterium]
MPETVAPRTRKPYPTHEERIVAADAKIEQLERLADERRVLLERSEALMLSRQQSLAKTEDALQAAIAKRDRIIELRDRPAKAAGGRGRRSVDRAALTQLQEALAASGKTVDDVLALLNN